MPPLSPRNIPDGYVTSIPETMVNVSDGQGVLNNVQNVLYPVSLIGSASQIYKDDPSDTLTVGMMTGEFLIIAESCHINVIYGEVEILGDYLFCP